MLPNLSWCWAPVWYHLHLGTWSLPSPGCCCMLPTYVSLRSLWPLQKIKKRLKKASIGKMQFTDIGNLSIKGTLWTYVYRRLFTTTNVTLISCWLHIFPIKLSLVCYLLTEDWGTQMHLEVLFFLNQSKDNIDVAKRYIFHLAKTLLKEP